MSTSPSWFDQDKLSRLVKKVGTKTLTELPHVQPIELDNRPAASNPASTARISLASRPGAHLMEQRSLPALPRRTGALPTLRSLFPKSGPPPIPALAGTAPVASSESTGPEAKTEVASAKHGQVEPPHSDAHATNDQAEPAPEIHAVIPSGQNEADLSAIWHKMSLLNEELARTVLERDQAQSESTLLREKLDELAEELEAVNPEPGAADDEVARLTKERDDALAEGRTLRAQLLQAKDGEKAPASPSETQPLAIVTGERDQARRQYADLRQQFEILKQEQAPKEETVKFRKEWEQQLEEREKEIATLKTSLAAGGMGEEKIRQEVTSLRDQVTRAKDEASVAQRGLALSQKALQQTRDTLREATEGTSLSRHNFDNLKNECAILAQQNAALQAQVDQLTRDSGPNKIKATTRLQH